ncbi:tyrosine-protein phosphatase [Kitasatospora purpeofusca]|uniref:tyrosine-protein phosphatase n=1 Tax=Kitasatospora purpeofusca TaxID=67352 RepID=UPI0022529897|nr:tyrosine-protein phosphatase [Kitasatospora purpeofusca]MCX4756950.1 tyrosine-protein phosphatase [Kitasatospora purpeofusca]WSR35281.1 tyrosine-protein phosphatase [Kitasatospora purpeofusca]WSR43601.1 tyrosine-protein phosphatase [Kitasatospora purpeofusca]
MSNSHTRLTAAVALTGALVLGTPALAVAAPAAGSASADSAAAAPAVARHAIPFTSATATQQADGSFTLSWTAHGARNVTVYAGTDPDDIRHRKAVAKGAGSASVTVTGLAAADRWFFELVPDRGAPLVVADRSLHLASAPNFRDAGGYRTADGQWVRTGVVYRSGDLSKLTDQDLAKLRRLGVRTVFDLRTPGEQKTAPDRIPAGATAVNANVLGVADTGAFNVTSPQAAVRAMVDAERTMVSADSARTAYHAVLNALVERNDENVLFHCTAGKDRTGWASAALLTALGVPRETVEADYLASNTYRAAEIAATLAQLPPAYQAIYKPLLDVRSEYLAAGFDEVQRKFGSFDGYLKSGLGLDKRDLRDLRSQLLVG